MYINISIDSCKLHEIFEAKVKVIATVAKKQINSFIHMGILLSFGYVANR